MYFHVNYLCVAATNAQSQLNVSHRSSQLSDAPAHVGAALSEGGERPVQRVAGTA